MDDLDVCPSCDGAGVIPDRFVGTLVDQTGRHWHPCGRCHGSGVVNAQASDETTPSPTP